MRRLFCALLFAAFAPGLHAENLVQNDPSELLRRIAAAAHQLNYSGTFVYQYGNHVETSRITHVVDEQGEREKFEALDGPPREIIRENDRVLCYLPGSKTVRVEKRNTRKFFPALLPKDVASLGQYYRIKLGEQERIAGYDCQAVILEPKDAYRYGHKLWADMGTGLLLRASTLNEKDQVVDQFAFTQLSIGASIDKTQLAPNPSWGRLVQQDDPSVVMASGPDATGWTVKNPPPGFTKIMELKRIMPGKKFPVDHLVYSDGLVAVSIFVEPLAPGADVVSGFSRQGVISAYAKPLPKYQITVLGEVPEVTVTEMANSVSRIEK